MAESADILAVHAATKPTKAALILGDRVVTFPQLHRRANRLANALRELGVGPGDRVATMSFNSVESSEIGHAGRRLTAVSVPINYHLRGREVAYIVNDCGARVVVAGADFVPIVEEARPEITGEVAFVAYGTAAPAGWLDYEELLAKVREDAVDADVGPIGASMIYTSGTTGHPKGAYRPQGVVIESVMQLIAAFELVESDIHLVAGPGYHSAVGFFSGLHQLIGSTVVIMPRYDATEALRLIQQHRVTTTFMAPTLIARMLNLPGAVKEPFDRSSMRALITGAAPCPISLKQKTVDYFGPVLWEFYGATETGINVILRPEDQLRKPGSAGQAIPGQEIRLVNEEGAQVPVGQPGEFLVRNTSLAEYYNRPDATAKSNRDGFFSVGDIAYVDDEGYYYICDRMIDMIISGGVNIYPAEVEAVLFEHPAIEDVAIIGVPNDEFGEDVKAVVKLKPGAAASAEEIIEFCRRRLAGYKRPKSVDFIDDFPRDVAGKTQKRRLRDRYWAETGRRI